MLFTGLERRLKHYEVIHMHDVAHKIVKREINPNSYEYNVIKELKFKALGRYGFILLGVKSF